jgi:hypothetical protein
MKIHLSIVVEVDPKAWANEYGIEPREVRSDVKLYFDSFVQEHVNNLGLQVKAIA